MAGQNAMCGHANFKDTYTYNRASDGDWWRTAHRHCPDCGGNWTYLPQRSGPPQGMMQSMTSDVYVRIPPRAERPVMILPMERYQELRAIEEAAKELTSTWRGEGNGRVSVWADKFDALRDALVRGQG